MMISMYAYSDYPLPNLYTREDIKEETNDCVAGAINIDPSVSTLFKLQAGAKDKETKYSTGTEVSSPLGPTMIYISTTTIN